MKFYSANKTQNKKQILTLILTNDLGQYIDGLENCHWTDFEELVKQILIWFIKSMILDRKWSITIC